MWVTVREQKAAHTTAKLDTGMTAMEVPITEAIDCLNAIELCINAQITVARHINTY